MHCAIEKLFLEYNQLTSQIPTTLGRLGNLSEYLLSLVVACLVFYASFSQFIRIYHFFSLVTIYLSLNELSGSIPTEMGLLSYLSKFETIYMFGGAVS
jgi:hypothetical protein